MLRIAAVILIACAVPGLAGAQVASVPVHYYPDGVSGVRVGGQFGVCASDCGTPDSHPTFIGGAATFGFGRFGFGVVGGSYDPDLPAQQGEIVYGGSIAYSLLNPRLPLSLAAQVGIGILQIGDLDVDPAEFTRLNVPIGVGIGFEIPDLILSVEPWIAPRIEIIRSDLDAVALAGDQTATKTGIGGSAGVNVTLASGLGAQAAVDIVSFEREVTLSGDVGDQTQLTFGLGLSWTFALPEPR